ncbi:hypothetical protein V1505DRAFT_351806, partial [Lipomyces doorenjongii]
MSSEINVFQCTMCNHAPFDTKAKLNKHTSSKHRTTATFNLSGQSFPLIVTDGNKYLCPNCKETQISSVRNLRRHMSQSCSSNQHHVSTVHPTIQSPTGHSLESEMEHTAAAVHSGTTEISEDDCMSMRGIGCTFNPRWNVLICNRCHYIVDKSMITSHLTNVHRLIIADKRAMFRTIQSYKLRPHLAIVWDELSEEGLGESDDEYSGPRAFEAEAFRPGQAAIDGISVLDGYKCVACESALKHRCVQSKEAMRTHYRRNHDNQVLEFHPVRVQAFYGRSSVNPQLRYVHVTQNNDTIMVQNETDNIEKFGIPANVHTVPASHAAITDKRDLNQFGIHFFAYKLLEWLDLAELGPLLQTPRVQEFEILKRISLQILNDSRMDTTAGFQVMLGKIMVEDKKREFFHEVQEQQTVDKYALIWCKVLWLACLKVKNQGTMTMNLTLSQDQTRSARELVNALDLIPDSHVDDNDELYL